MAYIISDECTNCGACDVECPSEAIIERKDKRAIDPDLCIDCGACESLCPAGAISAE